MRIKNNSGVVNAMLVPLMISVVLVAGLAVFGVWSYFQYTNQKNNVEDLVAEGIVTAVAAKEAELQENYDEQKKEPYLNYVSPSALGSVSITYPRTWSAYVQESGNNTKPLDGFFHPNFVPADSGVAYALRMTIETRDYDAELGTYKRNIEKGVVTAKPIKIEGVTGTILEGSITNKVKGAIVLMPLRDKTLSIWTESTAFLKDFKNVIVKNLTFDP